MDLGDRLIDRFFTPIDQMQNRPSNIHLRQRIIYRATQMVFDLFLNVEFPDISQESVRFRQKVKFSGLAKLAEPANSTTDLFASLSQGRELFQHHKAPRSTIDRAIYLH
ncbi:hypothetical protein [Octadecabacter arcticus]|uniref:hypothetical protein n=1 Tax=Octadecabacter arcticus TaxID=53946 RepID=UPI0005C4419E|nr:hypothetical protein [Octadecabacter arcticus]